MQRLRSIPTFEDHVAADKARLMARIAGLRESPEKDVLLEKMRRLETASHISDWISSRGLQPPKD